MMAIFAVIGSGTFQPANSNGLTVNFIATTNRLAGTSASTTKHARHDVAITVQQIRLVEARLRDQTNIGRNIGMGWTPNLAGNICLIPVKRSYDSLVSRFPLTHLINH